MAEANGELVSNEEVGESVVRDHDLHRKRKQPSCPSDALDKEAAISMLPPADPTDGMQCDSCGKDIKNVSVQDAVLEGPCDIVGVDKLMSLPFRVVELYARP